MPQPLSPRKPAPRLRSTGVLEGTGPRRAESDLQRRAIIQGYTFRAGPKTLARLHRGVVHESLEAAIAELESR